jgi:hypothetical protein
MTDLASTDVTVTEYPLLANLVPTSNRRFNVVDIAFGDGALTYPSGGVPMPSKDKFGMFDQIDAMLIESPSGNAYDYRYDRTNHKIRVRDLTASGAELTAGASAPAAATFRAVVIGG